MDLARRGVDLRGTLTEIVHRRLDGARILLNAADHRKDLREPFACCRDVLASLLRLGASRLHGGDGFLRLLLDGADEVADLLRCVLRLLGELSDLLGDDGEPMPVLTGTRCLDGGVEGEQVRLPRDARDHFDDVADLLGALAEFGDNLRGGDDRIGDGVHLIDRRHDELVALLCLLRGMLDVVGDVLDGARRIRESAREGMHLMLCLRDRVHLSVRRLRHLRDGLGDALRGVRRLLCRIR